MKAQTAFLWLIVIFLLLFFGPRGFWRELQNIWRRREFMLHIFFAIVCLYFIYAVYSLYSSGRLSW